VAVVTELEFFLDIVVRITVEVTCGVRFIEKWLPTVLAKVAFAIFRGE
jgi:hypothetical protein